MVWPIIYSVSMDKKFSRFCPETTALGQVLINSWKFKELVSQENDTIVQQN